MRGSLRRFLYHLEEMGGRRGEEGCRGRGEEGYRGRGEEGYRGRGEEGYRGRGEEREVKEEEGYKVYMCIAEVT